MRYKFGLVVILFTFGYASVAQEPLLDIEITNFTEWRQNATYYSSTSYSSKGMSPLYDAINYILSLIVEQKLIPDDYIIVTEESIKAGPRFKNSEWGGIAAMYWGLILITVISVLIVVLMPLIGLIFCCCRCAGSCGGRTQPFDKKGDGCRRGCWGLFLIILTSALIFGVVASFVTNAYFHQGVDNFTVAAKIGTKDTTTYLNKTSNEMNHLLVNNYNELSYNLNEILADTSTTIVYRFDNMSKGISLIQFNRFVQSLPQFQTDLERLLQLTNLIRVRASQLDDGFRAVKRELLVSLAACAAPECTEFIQKYDIVHLDVFDGIDYNKLPDEMIINVLKDVRDFINGDLMMTISQSEGVISDVRNKLITEINLNIGKIQLSIEDVGKSLKQLSNDISKVLDEATKLIDQNSNKYFDKADEYIEQYSVYSFWGAMGVCILLLLIVLCLILGLLCGICGRRPTGYGDDCCNKGAGSTCLMLAVAFIFLTISVLTIVCFALFLGGFVLRRGVCEPLSYPETSNLIVNYTDNFVDLNKFIYQNNTVLSKYSSNSKSSKESTSVQPLRMSHVIHNCHQNKTIYNVLRLHHLDDISNYTETYNVTQTLENFINGINVNKDVKILTPEVENLIRSLGSSTLAGFSAEKFFDNFAVNVTQHDVLKIATKLNETASKLTRPKFNDIINKLQHQSSVLVKLQETLIDKMLEDSQEMLKLASNFETKLKFNSRNFEEAMSELIKEIEFAEGFIANKSTTAVQEITRELLSGFTDEIKNYLAFLTNAFKNELGYCAPISTVYKSLLVAGCNRVVDPLNGFWAGIGWCILLFLIVIIISAKLSTLYQKSDPYPGPIVEAEYLYDAYNDRDVYPMANGPKQKRRKKYDRRRNSREHRECCESYPTQHVPIACDGPLNGSSGPSREARYNDMAPKHWEGGPPRYQSPPIAPPDPEYERPPPYYYAGAPQE